MFESEIPVDDCRNWRQAEEAFWALGPTFVCRGQANSNWTLQTTIERTATTLGAAETERLLLSAFKSRAHHYGLDLPEKADDLEWLALMQHHGVPTRLLDWTRSPYVATYFAAESASREINSFAVWAVDILWLKKTAIGILQRRCQRVDTEGAKALSLDTQLGDRGVFEKHFLNNGASCVAPVQARRINQRLTTQQGLFLCMGNIHETFEANLSQMREPQAGKVNTIRKIILPSMIRGEVLLKLASMNINRATLFPGFDGFCQYLAIQVSALCDQVAPNQQKLILDPIAKEFGF